MKYVVFMCRTINISISKWPRMGGNIQPAITDREDSCFWLLSQWSRVGHTLRPLFMLWFVKIWQVSLCRKFVQHLETFYFDSWSWLSLMFCDVFNCLFPLDVQNVIQILSRVFCYSCLVCLLGFWLRNTSLVKAGNPISHRFRFSPCLITGLES